MVSVEVKNKNKYRDSGNKAGGVSVMMGGKLERKGSNKRCNITMVD